jgi:transposase-like protein
MKTSEPIPQTPPAVKPRRHFDEDFKKEVVALLAGGRRITDLARELGVSHWNLRDWKARYGTGAAAAGLSARSAGQARGGEASPAAMAAELVDLRRELETVRRQRDILKKALAIVGQEPLNSTR